MLNVRWTRDPRLKRVLALAVLTYLLYVGYSKATALLHADRCLDAGGSYDPSSDTCRR